MKKAKLPLMVLSPIFIGVLFNNFLVFIPLFIYIAPFLMLIYWLFVIVADKERNLLLAVFSQMFTAPLSYITARIGFIFEQAPNEITQITTLVMQVTGLILMIVVFSSGYFYKKSRLKQHIN